MNVHINKRVCTVRTRNTGQVVLTSKEENGVYPVSYDDGKTGPVSYLSFARGVSLGSRHKCLGHISKRTIKRMARRGTVRDLLIADTTCAPCIVCMKAKMTRSPIKRRREAIPDDANAVCHTDLCGHFRRSSHGNKYMMSVSWRSHHWFFSLKKKKEATSKMAEFLSYIERHHQVNDQKLRVVRSDGGGEFIDRRFRKMCRKRGLRLQSSYADSPFENGVAERANRTIYDMATSMLVETNLPHSLWEYAAQHAVYVHSRIAITRSLESTSHERIFDKKPSLRDIRAFGDDVVVHVPDRQRSNALRFTPRGVKAQFMCYPTDRKGIIAHSREPTLRVRKTRDYKFVTLAGSARSQGLDVGKCKDRKCQPAEPNGSTEANNIYPTPPAYKGIQVLLNLPYSTSQRQPTTCKSLNSKLQSKEMAFYQLRMLLKTVYQQKTMVREEDHIPNQVEEEINGGNAMTSRRRSERISARGIGGGKMAVADVVREPLNMGEARRSKLWPYRREAIKKAIAALDKNDSGTLMPLPPGAKALDNTVQFRLKQDRELKLIYKARICAGGDKQPRI